MNITQPGAALEILPAAFFGKSNKQVGQNSSELFRWGATRGRIAECIQAVIGIPGMFLLVPTRACLPCAMWLVRSPADNAPNWVQMVTGEPLGESSPVKG